MLIRGERIEEIGKTSTLIYKYPNEDRVDARGNAVLPGFIDPHTHLVWAGDRAAEFEMRLQGKTYMEIMNAGGGIVATVNATRSASKEELLAQTRRRAQQMLRHGTTTAEAKSGYGLELTAELTQLEVLLDLDTEGPLDIVPTFLGAHAIPPEYAGRTAEYVALVCEQIFPALNSWWQQNAASRPLPFVDVFCEKGVFELEDSRRILTAAKKLGFPLKAHVDEFENLGGAGLAAKLGAISIEHAVKTSPGEIKALGKSDTVIVSLPCTPFGLAEPHYSPVKEMLAADCLLALATDLNPGTAWCESMQFVMALACRYLRLTPAQALVTATINAAKAIGRDHLVGSIEVGKQADFVILSVPDYRHLGYRFGGNLVENIVKKGKIINHVIH